MNYRFADRFEIFVMEDLASTGSPSWDKTNQGHHSLPVNFHRLGFNGATYRTIFWGSAHDFMGGQRPDPVSAAVAVIHDVTSAWNDPEEFVGMCKMETADQVLAVGAVMQFAEQFGDELAAFLDEHNLWDDEDLEAYLREIGE